MSFDHALPLIFMALMGVSMSTIFLAYTGASIATTFFVSAASFGALSLYGYTTKKDLSAFGKFLFMGVIGLVLFIAVIGTPQPGQMPSFGALGFMMVGFVVLSIAIRVFFTALVAAVHRQLAGSSSSMADAFV